MMSDKAYDQESEVPHHLIMVRMKMKIKIVVIIIVIISIRTLSTQRKITVLQLIDNTFLQHNANLGLLSALPLCQPHHLLQSPSVMRLTMVRSDCAS